MAETPFTLPGAPSDQAQGLRRLFAGRRLRHLVLVSNPHVPWTGVVLERLSRALEALRLRTLVVDAADSAPAPPELAAIDLAACVETIGPQLSYLAARGLPLRHVDTRGSAAALLDRLEAAAPAVDVMLLHAGASDLVRLFGARVPRAVLLAGDAPDSVTHAYAGMKLLALRSGLMRFDLLLTLPPRHRLAARIAERLASCAEGFLGAVLQPPVAVDPATDAGEPPDDALLRLVAAQVAAEADAPSMAWPAAGAPHRQPTLTPN